MLKNISLQELPKGWEVFELQDICHKVTDGTHKTPAYQETGVRFISIKNIRPFQEINWDSYKKFITREAHEELIRRCHPEYDDILFPRIGTLGFAKRIDFKETVSIFVGLGLLKPIKGVILPKYLEYYMNTSFIYELSHKKATGSGRLTLPLAESRKFPVPLAPIDEQARIVAEIEKQFFRLDEAVENLKRVKANLKRYKASVLKTAVEGKLTEEWRKANPDVEPAGKLLERILVERRKKWGEAEFAKMYTKGLPAPKKSLWFVYVVLCDDNSFYIGASNDLKRRWTEHTTGQGAEWTKTHKPIKIIHHEEFSSQKEVYKREKELKTGFGRKWLKREFKAGRLRQAGKVPKDDKWKKKYKEPVLPSIEGAPEFPASWYFVGIEQILPAKKGAMKTGPFGSLLKKYEHQQKGIQVLGIENIQAMNFVFGSKIHIDSEKAKELFGYRAVPGDILLSRSGTVGEVCVVPYNIGDARISTNLMKLSLEKDGMLPQFFTFLFNGSPFILNQVSDLCKGSTRNFLNQDILKKLVFILPPLKEQRIIIQEVEKKFSIIDGIEKEVDRNLIRADRLRQSVLKKAFSGKLVPQSNNDESIKRNIQRQRIKS